MGGCNGNEKGRMSALIEIANRAIADYGFRQAALWSPGDVAARWELSPAETAVLEGALHDALDALPIPVEPDDIPAQQERIAALIREEL